MKAQITIQKMKDPVTAQKV